MESVAVVEVETYNRELIDRYIDQKKRGLSLGRKKKIRYTLLTLARKVFKKGLDKVTKEEIEEFIELVRNNDLEVEYEQSTRVDFLKISKPFFAWLHPEDREFSTWIRTGSYQPTVGPDDILILEERQRMKACLMTPRDKAMFESLYESAARPKEFLSLLKSDIGFDSDSASIHIRKGKTGYPRDITLVQDAFPLLKTWLFNEHPLRNEPDYSLWVDMSANSKHDPLQQVGLRRFLERVAHAAHIEKRITPYTLRHTRLTDLAREGANEALLCQIAGWKLGSKMPAVYIHLSKRDQKPALQKLLGLKKEEEESTQVVQRPKVCAQCKTVNTSDAHVCMNCRMALDTQTAVAMIRERQNSEQQLRAEYEKFKRITRLTLLLDRETDPARRVEIATELEKLLD